jgi:RNA polymerase sigma factor (sigma-70 family)
MRSKTAVEQLLAEYRRTRSRRVEGRLCEMLCPTVCNRVRTKLGASGLHGHILDDAESYAMEAVLQCIRAFNGRGRFMGFLYTKVHRMVLDGLSDESGYRRAVSVDPVEFLPEFPVPEDSDNETMQSVATEILKGLRSDHRAVLERVFLDGALRQDVAKEIGRHPSRITQICRDSVKWLRRREKDRKRRKYV